MTTSCETLIDLIRLPKETPSRLEAIRSFIEKAKQANEILEAAAKAIRDNGLAEFMPRELSTGNLTLSNQDQRAKKTDNGQQIDNPTYQQSPLVVAAILGDEAVVNLLLENGAIDNILDNQGRTALFWATHKGHGNIVNALLKKFVQERTEPLKINTKHGQAVYVNVKDNQGNAALGEAVFQLNPDITTALRMAGADPNGKYHRDKDSCHYPAVVFLKDQAEDPQSEEKNLTTLKALIEPKPTDSQLESKHTVDKITTLNISEAIRFSTCYKKPKCTKYLADLGADINLEPGQEARRPLHYAVTKLQKITDQKLYIETIKVLLEAKTDTPLDLEAKGEFPCTVKDCKQKNAMTALTYAAEQKMADVVELLVKHGASVKAVDSHGRNALYLAIQQDWVDGIVFLVEQGADLNNLSDNGNPLGWMVAKTKDPMMTLKRVIDKTKGKSNAPSPESYSIGLAWAAAQDKVKAFELLLPLAGNLDYFDGKEKTSDYVKDKAEISKLYKAEVQKRKKEQLLKDQQEAPQKKAQAEIKFVEDNRVKIETQRIKKDELLKETQLQLKKLQVNEQISSNSKPPQESIPRVTELVTINTSLQKSSSVVTEVMESFETKLPTQDSPQKLARALKLAIDQDLQATLNKTTHAKLLDRPDELFKFLAPNFYKIYEQLLGMHAYHVFITPIDDSGEIALHSAVAGKNSAISEIIIKKLLAYWPYTQLAAKKKGTILSDTAKAIATADNKKVIDELKVSPQFGDYAHYVKEKEKRGFVGLFTKLMEAENLAQRVCCMRALCNFLEKRDLGMRPHKLDNGKLVTYQITMQETIAIYADMTTAKCKPNAIASNEHPSLLKRLTDNIASEYERWKNYLRIWEPARYKRLMEQDLFPLENIESTHEVKAVASTGNTSEGTTSSPQKSLPGGTVYAALISGLQPEPPTVTLDGGIGSTSVQLVQSGTSVRLQHS